MRTISASELSARFDELSAAIGPAQEKCNKTYIAWSEARDEWNNLTRERDEIWGKMLDPYAPRLWRPTDGNV